MNIVCFIFIHADINTISWLASFFPRNDTMEILANFETPFTAVVLDFNEYYRWDNMSMFEPGPIGQRVPDQQHIDAVADFASTMEQATRRSTERHLQVSFSLFVLISLARTMFDMYMLCVALLMCTLGSIVTAFPVKRPHCSTQPVAKSQYHNCVWHAIG